MLKLIKSMLYRVTHDIFFYIAAGLCILSMIALFGLFAGSFKNHVESRYDKNVIVKYEEEDVLNVSKHLVMGSSDCRNVPGHDIKYADSLENAHAAGNVIIILSISVLLLHVLYAVVFFGELFSKGAIRNMISTGSAKSKIYLSSLLVNMVILLAFSLISFLTVVIYVRANDIYLFLYAPALLLCLFAEYLVWVVISSLMILLIFIIQRPMKALLVFIGIAVLYCFLVSAVNLSGAFYSKNKHDNKAFSHFFRECKENGSEVEWYIPAKDFNLNVIYKADGTIYKDFTTAEPDPEYPGGAKVAVARAFWRMSITNMPLEMVMFDLYPLYRDGVLLRYIIVSSVYLCVLAAGGLFVVKRRDII